MEIKTLGALLKTFWGFSPLCQPLAAPLLHASCFNRNNYHISPNAPTHWVDIRLRIAATFYASLCINNNEKIWHRIDCQFWIAAQCQLRLTHLCLMAQPITSPPIAIKHLSFTTPPAPTQTHVQHTTV